MTMAGGSSRASLWSGGEAVGRLGEFGTIARIREQVCAARGAVDRDRMDGELRLSIGDDAALLHPPPGWDLLLTCDIQIEDHHFRRDWMTPREVGARAAAVNLSDIAAMGGVPVAALVSLGLPEDLPQSALSGIYEGMIDQLARHEATIAGGNLSRASQLLLDVTLVGRVEEGCALRRGGARAGEQVFVTGYPGRSAAALATLQQGGSGTTGEPFELLRQAYAAPRARIAAGRFLVENRIAGAAIDQSDGLGGDLGHICEESGVGIILSAEELPVDPELIRLGSALEVDPLHWVLGPSDDYELLFTVPREKVELALAMQPALGLPVTLIGEVVAGPPGVRLRRRGGGLAEVSAGWDHLREV